MTLNDAPQSVGLLWTSISSSQWPLPDKTQHSQQTAIHSPSSIRTRNPSKPAATDPSLNLHGHWDRRYNPYLWIFMSQENVTFNHVTFRSSHSTCWYHHTVPFLIPPLPFNQKICLFHEHPNLPPSSSLQVINVRNSFLSSVAGRVSNLTYLLHGAESFLRS